MAMQPHVLARASGDGLDDSSCLEQLIIRDCALASGPADEWHKFPDSVGNIAMH